MLVLYIIAAFQLTQPPTIVRGDDFEIAVPHGWIVSNKAIGGFINLEHSTGASLRVTTGRPTEAFDNYSRRAVERIANPLGFAKIGEPRHYSDSNQELFEYVVRGNRLADRRRILYRAIRNQTSVTEIVYENSEERFDILVSEALSIAGSLKLVPRSVARKVRVRQ